jgi:hypothetical protein
VDIWKLLEKELEQLEQTQHIQKVHRRHHIPILQSIHRMRYQNHQSPLSGNRVELVQLRRARPRRRHTHTES